MIKLIREWLSKMLAPTSEKPQPMTAERVEEWMAALPPTDFRQEVMGVPCDHGPLVGESGWIVRGGYVLPCELRGYVDGGFDVYVPQRGSLWTRTVYGSYDAAFEQVVLKRVITEMESAPKVPHLRLVSGDDE